MWSPLGLVQPTTLPFGQRNSGTETQGPYRAAANELNKGRHGNYVDDWVGYANTTDQLFEDFALFLRVCRKYAITLGPPKTRFGFKEAQFFGFRVNKEGSHLALKHLDPIRNLVPPVDVHELRRVLFGSVRCEQEIHKRLCDAYETDDAAAQGQGDHVYLGGAPATCFRRRAG